MPKPSIADIIARLRARAEAAGVRCVVLPPLQGTRITAIEREVGGIPPELAGLLAVTTGLELGEEMLDFASSFHVSETPPPPQSPWRLFPRRLDVGTSKDLGRYIVDLGRPGAAIAPVFGLWPNPPVLRLVAPSIGDFLMDIARRMPAKGENSTWDFVPLQGAYNSNEGAAESRNKPDKLLSERQAKRLADPVLYAYLARLPARTWLWDLRQANAGLTMEWSGHRVVSEFHRHPSELIFGTTIPARWWRPTALITGSPSRWERRRWSAAFSQE